jgi:predicted amidohydrolase YtcJ
VHRAGIQVNCHANGDVAIDMYLTAFERAQKAAPRPDARPKITHCTLINDDLVRRMKALGAVPAMFTTYAYYNTDKFPFYGEELMKRSMAFRTLLDAGIHAAAGSDFSPGPFAALMGIQGMVTRTGWDGTTWGANQRVTVDEAIRINTRNGAYASHEERSRARSRRASWRTSSSWRTTRTPLPKTRSRTFRSCGRSSEVRQCMRPDTSGELHRCLTAERGPLSWNA